jgi:DNA replication protein DnaC
MSFELTGSDELEFNQFKQDLVKKYNKASEYDLFEDPVCVEEMRLEYRKLSANIPLKFRRTSLKDVEDNKLLVKAIGEVNDYVAHIKKRKETGAALYFYSEQTGTAKTLLGCYILSQAIQRGYTAYFAEVNSCIEKLTAGWYDEADKISFKQDILEVDFLLIDDLGSELQTDNSSKLIQAGLHQILRERANHLRPTFITSNLSRQKIIGIYNFRIDSILHEHMRDVECIGIDYRKGPINQQRNLK